MEVEKQIDSENPESNATGNHWHLPWQPDELEIRP
jgi:hypothetical protein